MGDPNTGEIYREPLRDPKHIGLSDEQATHLKQLHPEQRIDELQNMVQKREAATPDIRTLDGALSYLNYHAPNDDTRPRHEAVNGHFTHLLASIWTFLPDGPGKTVAIRAIGRARMECNSCIANNGA